MEARLVGTFLPLRSETWLLVPQRKTTQIVGGGLRLAARCEKRSVVGRQ
jgi:hypothetical protein